MSIISSSQSLGDQFGNNPHSWCPWAFSAQSEADVPPSGETPLFIAILSCSSQLRRQTQAVESAIKS